MTPMAMPAAAPGAIGSTTAASVGGAEEALKVVDALGCAEVGPGTGPGAGDGPIDEVAAREESVEVVVVEVSVGAGAGLGVGDGGGGDGDGGRGLGGVDGGAEGGVEGGITPTNSLKTC